MNEWIENMNFPKRLVPHYKVRTPGGIITLCQTTAEIKTKTKKIRIKGRIVFTLNPKLDVQFKAAEPINDFETYLLLLDDNTNLTIDDYPDAKWMIYSTNPVSAFLTSKIHQSTTDQVEFLNFFILNFPDILGGSYIVHQNKVTLTRLNLMPMNWQLTIDNLFSELKVKELLRKNSGYAITQIGRLEKTDNTLFEIEDGMTLLKELENFLGFANGNWTPIILIEGFIDKNKVFFEWKNPSKSNKWEYRNSWLDAHHAQSILEEGLPKYLALQANPLWSIALPRAVYFYVLSNNTQFVDGSLMIAQTVIELLAWNYLVEQKMALSKSKYQKLNTSERFEILLEKLAIPNEIPKQFDELNEWSKQNEINNGMEAIIKIRNNLIHPEIRKISSLPNAVVIYEVRELALWFIEMIMLRLCEYTGIYSNRLRIRWTGQVEHVPWITK